MATKTQPNSKDLFFEIINNTKTRNDYFNYKISYYQKDSNSEFFPKRITEFVPLVMNEKEGKDYEKLTDGDVSILNKMNDFDFSGETEKSLTSFYNVGRQVSNFMGDYKETFIITRIKNH